MKPRPTIKRLREVFRYNRKTGILSWRVHWSSRVPGDRAGTRGGGYYWVTLDGVKMLVHRVIWAVVTGSWPIANVDHRDLDGHNNRWRNLREATHSQNLGNASNRKNNTSGFKGVSLSRGCRDRWMAKITIKRRQIYLGSFGTRKEAHAAYLAAAKEHFGEFARAA